MPTPTVRKLQLGNELRYLREQAGMSQEEAGKLVEKRQGKIAELEAGQSTITPGDLRELLRGYGVTDQERIDFLMELRRGNSHRGRWTSYRSVYPDQFRQYVDLEEDAELIRTVESEVPPGLLQSEPFIRALYEELPNMTPDEIENGVKARQLRQQVLQRGTQAHFVISESSLCRCYGSREIMREQIDHMVRMSRLPNVQLQVLPFTTRTNVSPAVGFRFVLLQIPSPGSAGALEFAYVEGVDANRYLDDKKAVQPYVNLWSRLTAAALGPADSRAFMREAANKYHG